MKRSRWIVPAILVGFPISVVLIYTLRVGNEYRHEVDLARSAGLLITVDDLAPKPIPPAENAATDYLGAIAAYKATPAKSQELVSAFDYKNIRGMTSWHDWLQRNGYAPGTGGGALEAACIEFKPAFDLLRKATMKPKLAFRRDWSIPGVGFEPFGQIRMLARALVVDSTRPRRASDLDGLLDNLKTLRKMAHHLYQEPGLDALNLGEWLEAKAVSGALEVAWNQRGNGKNVSQVRRFLSEPQEPFVFRDRIPSAMLEFTRVIDFLQIDPWALGYKPDDMNGPGMMKYKLLAVREKTKADALRYGRQLYAMLDGTGRDFPVMLTRMRQGNISIPIDEMNDVLAGPSLDLSYDVLRGASYEARRRQAIVCTYLIDIFREKGAFPAALHPLGEIAKDPFTGEPMKYSSDGKQCLLYSVGANLTDDAATEPRFPWRGTNGDIGTCLPIEQPPRKKAHPIGGRIQN